MSDMASNEPHEPDQSDHPGEAGEPAPVGGQEASGQAEEEATEEQPLARVRYGLGKELQLFPDSLVILRREEFEADRFALAHVRRIILTPGDPNPSKLILMLELDEGDTILAAEGMSNVGEFRTLLSKLREIAPQIETDPPDMDAQLGQALDIRRRSLLGCYGSIAAACVLAYLLYLALAYFGAHAVH
ncbi:MAG TPA: hypothetical protein VFU60_06620 [Ktedonobacterales bacterium]|nr:hypothetical protein [Ktedonobacterales bacterium]